jgi:hypothetical protein
MTQWQRIVALAGGGLILAQAARKRSLPNLFLFAFGAELLRLGITGHPLFPKREEPVEDIVDLASELSFPASDPPAY